ncbi:hypothetical protein E2R62_24780 [Citrobacter rodentium]|uniref:Uncharacterized protein n=1 Tax=Citrobacter rodentium TaxID=67825 RepID=A0A482PLL5_CITRO|nr:hypothetical protein E2R62_24780 [Citrobacter rodentium]HAT8012848.1 hypothetical protein [Citrobacter rodentium NBRC 105723 = DSM 16636]HAT8016989.1 hypothetical protein [Citrobacter rodentium]HAT8027838.1 hypothetical protein [Citrobacter rodentium]HAT8031889.1 hypothetical protein [Citrobacter rodentium]
MPQPLVLIETVKESHKNPEQFSLSIHYYFRISQLIILHKLPWSQSGERDGASGRIRYGWHPAYAQSPDG